MVANIAADSAIAERALVDGAVAVVALLEVQQVPAGRRAGRRMPGVRSAVRDQAGFA